MDEDNTNLGAVEAWRTMVGAGVGIKDGIASAYVTALGEVTDKTAEPDYLDWCGKNAARLGLYGWIRGRADGCVEAVYHGPLDRVDEAIVLAAEGPAGVAVTDLLASPCDPPKNAGFQLRTPL